jgi:hypothetical protein
LEDHRALPVSLLIGNPVQSLMLLHQNHGLKRIKTGKRQREHLRLSNKKSSAWLVADVAHLFNTRENGSRNKICLAAQPKTADSIHDLILDSISFS